MDYKWMFIIVLIAGVLVMSWWNVQQDEVIEDNKGLTAWAQCDAIDNSLAIDSLGILIKSLAVYKESVSFDSLKEITRANAIVLLYLLDIEGIPPPLGAGDGAPAPEFRYGDGKLVKMDEREDAIYEFNLNPEKE